LDRLYSPGPLAGDTDVAGAKKLQGQRPGPYPRKEPPMLVLSRMRDESVMVGHDVEVKVVDIRGDKVRLGFSAPPQISVDRLEVYQQKHPRGRPPTAQAALTPQERATMDPFLRAAIDEAKKGLSEGGLPIGSVLVRNGQIIGRGHNRRVQNGDPMAHAEIDCLTNAGRQKTYADTVLYSTLMPCYRRGHPVRRPQGSRRRIGQLLRRRRQVGQVPRLHARQRR
jgi:carbon storage regulator CsrA